MMIIPKNNNRWEKNKSSTIVLQELEFLIYLLRIKGRY